MKKTFIILIMMSILACLMATQMLTVEAAAAEVPDYSTISTETEFDVNGDSVVDADDFTEMSMAVVNGSDTRNYSILDVIQLIRVLHGCTEELPTTRTFDVANFELSDENVRVIQNYFASDFDRFYVQGFDGSVQILFADERYCFDFSSEIVKYDDPSFSKALVIASYPCPEKYETLYATIYRGEFVLFVESDTPDEVRRIELADVSEADVLDTIRVIHALSSSDMPKHVKETPDGSVIVTFAKAYVISADATKNCVVYSAPDDSDNVTLVTTIIVAGEGTLNIYVVPDADGTEKFLAYIER